MKTSFIYSIISIFLFIGCNSSVKNETIYFGGKINNPKDNKVVILKKDKPIASVNLDFDNKFMFKLDSLDTGLYKFKHGEEFQYIYLEQKDSLLIRLNTWDFDGSLVFSGKGANRNNFLIQLFIENEKDNRKFNKYFKLDEDNFTSKIDSFISIKKLLYKQFKENSISQTKEFDDLISAVMYYHIYANKEEYPLHYKDNHNLDELPKLSKGFYSHRKTIQSKSNLFKDYHSYKNYLWNRIYNSAYYKLEKDDNSNITAELLNQINNLVKNDDLKNTMLYQTYVNSLFDSSCSIKNKDLSKKMFYKFCSNDNKKEKVSNLLNVIKTLTKGNKLPEFYLKSVNNKIINSNDFIGNDLVIYFWPKELNRVRNMAKRVIFLEKKYPKIRFIGINNQTNSNWKVYSKENGLKISNQFQLTENNKDTFFTNEFPRAVIVNKNGIIQNNFSLISQRNFEKLLILNDW